jgi:hypothetical protein
MLGRADGSSAASEMVRKAWGLFATPIRPPPAASWTRAFMIWEARKLMTGAGSIAAGSPVLGLRPMRARLSRTWKTPKPGQLHRLAAFQRLDDQIQGALDHRGAFLPRQAHFFVDRLAQIRAGQCALFMPRFVPPLRTVDAHPFIKGENPKQNESRRQA